MGSDHRSRVFDPLDLEVIDRVFEAAWAKIQADDLFHYIGNSDERREALRKRVMALAEDHPVDFDALFDKVMGNTPHTWAVPSGKKPRGSPPQVGA